MDGDKDKYGSHPLLTMPAPAKKELLTAFLMQNMSPLLGTLCAYVQRMGLVRDGDVKAVALDVLQEVVVEALAHAERFNTTGQPMAWLLGIAINVIKRKKVEFVKRSWREMPIAHLFTTENESLSEGELFDLLASCPQVAPEQDIEANEQAFLMLALVSPEDQHILRLAFLYDFDREVLAAQLGITAVAARTRLHRALKRLRTAWYKQQKGASNES